MAVTVTVEDGTLVSGANSFVTTAEVDAWVLTNPHDSTWSSLTDAQKNGYTVMACRVMCEQIDWDGWQTDDEQALDLPRSGMVDKNGNSIDKNEIPQQIKNAQCEMARLLAVKDRTADADTMGFSHIGVGTISLDINKSDRSPVLPDAVWQMLRWYGTKINPKGIAQVIRT